MKRQQNTPTVQYCIEGTLPGGNIAIERFTIEQVETGPKIGCCDHRNYNTVQSHLDDLGKRTGLAYRIVRWGDVRDRRAWVAGAVFND